MGYKQIELPTSGRGCRRTEYCGRNVDRMVYEFIERENIPGLTLAIVQAPYISRVVGYGYADATTHRLASTNTIWAAADISQAFCAVATIQLYEQDGIKLDRTIATYLDCLPEEWCNVTVMQLMQQSSGIPDYRTSKNYEPSKKYTPQQLIYLAAELPTLFRIGHDVSASATNYLLLTMIIEKVSGMSYREYVYKYQIDALGLHHTVFTEDFDKVAQEKLSSPDFRHSEFKIDKKYINPTEVATGYRNDGRGSIVQATYADSSAVRGFADIWSSAEDISTWDIALAGSILVKKPENRDIIYNPTKIAGGVSVRSMSGWNFYAHKGLMDIKGSSCGFSAYLSRFTDASELVCVTLMANREGVDFTSLARSIAAAFDNERLGNDINDNLFESYESQFNVSETVARIKSALSRHNMPLFAVFDHGMNAADIGFDMRPTQVVVFGTPQVGTRLMLLNQSVANELPLRITVMQDENGSTWVFYPRMRRTAQKYGMEDEAANIIEIIDKTLQTIVHESIHVYGQPHTVEKELEKAY